jgi:anti-sigma B factor antagonist
MRVKIKGGHAANIISLDGDFLTEINQRQVRQKLLELVGQGTTHIVIDLTNVRHINSCGLGVLVCALTTVKKLNGELRLAGLSAEVANLLKITHLDSVFQSAPTASAAILDFSVRQN